MSIYDPLGLLSHVLIFPRILLQKCVASTDWRQWTSSFPKIEEIQIPRWLGYHNEVIDPEHVYTDASKEAYMRL